MFIPSVAIEYTWIDVCILLNILVSHIEDNLHVYLMNVVLCELLRYIWEML